jgi:hypothetical protein
MTTSCTTKATFTSPYSDAANKYCETVTSLDDRSRVLPKGNMISYTERQKKFACPLKNQNSPW